MLASSHGYCIKKYRSNLLSEIKEMSGLRDTMMKKCSSLTTLRDKVARDYIWLSAMDTRTLDSKQREVARAWFTSPSFIASMIPLSNGSFEQLYDSLPLLDDV